jgi:DNA primase
MKESGSAARASESRGEVTLTHPDKQLYPGSSITKRDLADYYEKVAPLMLEQIKAGPSASCVAQPASGAETLSPFRQAGETSGR